MLLHTGPRLRPAATLIAARWGDLDAAKLAATLTNPAVRALHPILVGPVPQYATDLPRILALTQGRNSAAVLRRELLPKVFETDRTMRAIARRTGTPYLSPLDAICDRSRQCVVWAAPGVPLAFDYGHLTAAGSTLLIDRLMPQIDRVAGRP